MTARCALYMAALKILGVPDYAPAIFPRHFNGLFSDNPIDSVNVYTKFEVCSFTRSRDNRGTQKVEQSLNTPTRPFL